MSKKWQVTRPISEETKGEFSGLNPVVLQLLFNRGLKTQKEMDAFLRSDWHSEIHDPFLLGDMHKAVEMVFKALENKKKIQIFGDYDADGISGTTILHDALQRVGFDEVGTYVPHRDKEGYGLNEDAVKRFKKEGVDLLITVDLGISNIAQIKVARELGLDVIVVDHHDFQIDEKGEILLPEANAIIHPRLPSCKYPFGYLSGGGVAFKLAQALLSQTMEENEAFEKWLLDMVAISTVADMVPLTGENRTLVKYGLLVLNKTQRLGLKELLYVSAMGQQKKLDAWNIAFQIAPRINAAGRISHAQEALSLVLCSDEDKARELATHLNDINQERQKYSEQIYKEALKQISSPPYEGGEREGVVGSQEYLLSGFSPDWFFGIVGLVAGKISNKFHRPVVLMTEVGGEVKGSARSIPEFHITKALHQVKYLLDQQGGHAGAAGFKVKKGKKDEFVKALSMIAEKELKGQDLRPSLAIDLEVDFAQVNSELADQIVQFEPFGEANPMPLFLSRRVKIEKIGTVGSKNQHLKLEVSDEFGKNKCKAIGFGLANGWKEELQVSNKIDIVYELGFNEWNGSRELQIKLKDLKKSFS